MNSTFYPPPRLDPSIFKAPKIKYDTLHTHIRERSTHIVFVPRSIALSLSACFYIFFMVILSLFDYFPFPPFLSSRVLQPFFVAYSFQCVAVVDIKQSAYAALLGPLPSSSTLLRLVYVESFIFVE